MTCKHELYSLSFQTKKGGIKKYHKIDSKFCVNCERVIPQ
jgi:hypothetical protein